MTNRKYRLIIPSGRKPYPDKYELLIGELCTQKFQSDIIFIQPEQRTTPDIEIVNTKQRWEIKNIRSNSKYTIEDNLRKAEKQSKNVIISLLKPTKMTTKQAISRINFYLSHKNTKVEKIILVTKDKKMIDIKS